MGQKELIWVKAAPSSDPGLRGKECVRKPWDRARKFNSEPEEVELTPEVMRMLSLGDIVRCDPKE